MYSIEYCMNCNSRARQKLNIPDRFRYVSLREDGTFAGSNLWFCSLRCYREAINKYITDPDHKVEKVYHNELSIGWQNESIRNACEEFIRRANAQIEYENKKRQEEYDEEQRKKRERDQREAQREQERLEREMEREEERERREAERKRKEEIWLEDRRQREEDRKGREQERLEEKRQKEEEKRRIEQEKLEAQQRAEEERIEAMRPREIPLSARFSHTHVLGASGARKTTLIIKHLKQDLTQPEKPTIFIIDPKGTLVDRLSRHLRFQFVYFILDTHLVLIDPARYSPALNMFAKPKQTYS